MIRMAMARAKEDGPSSCSWARVWSWCCSVDEGSVFPADTFADDEDEELAEEDDAGDEELADISSNERSTPGTSFASGKPVVCSVRAILAADPG